MKRTTSRTAPPDALEPHPVPHLARLGLLAPAKAQPLMNRAERRAAIRQWTRRDASVDASRRRPVSGV